MAFSGLVAVHYRASPTLSEPQPDDSWWVTAGTKLGPAYLFFGCRKRTEDYIYEEELEAYARDGTVTRLFVAFSREGAAKDYVQHHMARESALIAPVLRESAGGYFYVCGDAKHMAKVRR